jgi:hypothetical protein
VFFLAICRCMATVGASAHEKGAGHAARRPFNRVTAGDNYAGPSAARIASRNICAILACTAFVG